MYIVKFRDGSEKVVWIDSYDEYCEYASRGDVASITHEIVAAPVTVRDDPESPPADDDEDELVERERSLDRIDGDGGGGDGTDQ